MSEACSKIPSSLFFSNFSFTFAEIFLNEKYFGIIDNGGNVEL